MMKAISTHPNTTKNHISNDQALGGTARKRALNDLLEASMHLPFQHVS